MPLRPRPARACVEEPPIDRDHARAVLLDALAAVAPEAQLSQLAPDQPLRDQVDLDSLDWVNLLAGAGLAATAGPQATLDELVTALALRPDASTGADDTNDLPMPASVTLRPLGAADAAREDAFVRALSDESRYKRFMVALPALPPAKLAFLTDVDQVRHVALAAVLDAGQPAERLVGVARYIVEDGGDGRGCEFALTVADDWQRTGLAGRLMHTLMARARAAGLTRMRGEILAANRPMLKFVRQLGFSAAPMPGDARTIEASRTL